MQPSERPTLVMWVYIMAVYEDAAKAADTGGQSFQTCIRPVLVSTLPAALAGTMCCCMKQPLHRGRMHDSLVQDLKTEKADARQPPHPSGIAFSTLQLRAKLISMKKLLQTSDQ